MFDIIKWLMKGQDIKEGFLKFKIQNKNRNAQNAKKKFCFTIRSSINRYCNKPHI